MGPAEAVVGCNRREIRRRDRDRNARHVRVAAAIVRFVGERIGAGEVGRGRVDERTVGLQHDRAVRRAAHQDRAERIAVRVGVVREHSRCVDGQRRVLVRRVRVRVGDWQVVRRRDRDRDARHVRIAAAIVCRVGERIGAGEVGRRRVGERAIGLQGKRAVRWPAHQDRGERIAVRVGVVREHTRSGSRERSILRRVEAVVHRHRQRDSAESPSSRSSPARPMASSRRRSTPDRRDTADTASCRRWRRPTR